MIQNNRFRHPIRRARQRGFSLLEVLIAVVVLSTGLLALAALQGSLARASADAKVRSQVASMLQARMDTLRGSGYGNAWLAPGATTTTSTTDPCDGDATDWVDCARERASLGSLTVTQTNTDWTSAVGAGAFAPGAPVDPDDPQFKRIQIQAVWTDATGANHRLAMVSDLSELSLKDGLIVPPDDTSLDALSPVVRQDSPVVAGVIPIALGNGQASAASNPAPEIIGKGGNESVVGTRFNVLTYVPETGNAAVIQRRFENSLIRCKCQYGAAGTGFANLPEIYRVPQWPAVWTGERYDVFTPDSVTAAPGTAFKSAPVANADQSPLCQECCRDHHDTALTGAGRYDPERTDSVGKHDVNNQGDLTVTPVNTNNGTYVNACRVIRVDGFWRTASDTYSRHFGLLATEEVPPKLAVSGVPSATAANAYQDFVKTYLGGYSGTTTPAAGVADTLFNEPARGLNNPASIDINRPSPKDERYLHGRGLYVDYLEQEARDKLDDALDGCSISPTVECILPYLPFTTINVTELAFWQAMKDGAESNSVIDVATASSLIFDPLQPTRGRTNALGTATDGATADATAFITPSNAGLAVSTTGVDPQDDVDLTDAQTFVVSAPGTPGSGGKFDAQLNGLPQTGDDNTLNDPAVAYTIMADLGNCGGTLGKKDNDPNLYVCNTSTALPATSGNVLLANYGREITVPQASSLIITGGQCSYNGSPVTIQTTTVQVPAFENYQVASAVMPGSAVTIGTAVNDGRKIEQTPLTLTPVVGDATLTVGFTLQGGAATLARFVSCTANKKGKDYELNTVTWSKPWE